MVTKVVTYKGFDGEDIEEKIYLRLTKAEFAKLDRSYQKDGGFINYFRKLLTDMQESLRSGVQDYTLAYPLIEFLETIILAAYGEKTEDGRFIKKKYGQPLADEFESSQAYSELLMHLISSEEGMNEIEPLILGIMPTEGVDMEVVNEKKEQLMEKFQKG